MRLTQARPARSLVIWLGIAVCLVYLLTAGSNFSSGDSFSELRVTQSLVEHGAANVPISNPHQRCAGWGCRGSDGRYYASHGIAFSLYLLPFYGLAQTAIKIFPGAHCDTWDACVPIHLISWSNCLLAALIVALLCLLCLDLGYPRRRALALAALYGFSTLAWPYARFAFDVSLTGLLLLAAVREALLGGDRDSSGEGRWWRAGLFGGLAILTRLPTIPALAPIAVWAALAPAPDATARWRRTLAFAIPVVASLAFSAWYNAARFGSVFNDGHLHNAADQFTFQPWVGIVGMTISPGKGLLWYCPVIMFALVALPRFDARHRVACRLALAVAACSLLPYLFVPDWYGGDAWGPRFLLPVLPLLILPAVEAPPILTASPVRRLVAAAILVLAVLMQIVGQLVSYPLRLRLAARQGLGDALLWDPRHSPIVDQVGTLITYLTHLSAVGEPTSRAESFDIWWLNLWRNDGLPRGPVLLAALALLGLTLVAGAQLVRAARADS